MSQYIGKESHTAIPLNVNFNAATPVLIQFIWSILDTRLIEKLRNWNPV
jgi:hypothetical protein